MLEGILRQIRASEGLTHLAWVRFARDYVRARPEVDIIKELEGIKELDLLKAMLEVGARGLIYGYILDRLGKV